METRPDKHKPDEDSLNLDTKFIHIGASKIWNNFLIKPTSLMIQCMLVPNVKFEVKSTPKPDCSQALITGISSYPELWYYILAHMGNV